jgi:hypothetical protein
MIVIAVVTSDHDTKDIKEFGKRVGGGVERRHVVATWETNPPFSLLMPFFLTFLSPYSLFCKMVLYSGSKNCIVPLFFIGIKSPDLFHISHGVKKTASGLYHQDRTWSLGAYAAFSKYGLSDNNELTT